MGTNRRDTSTWPSPGFSRSRKIRTPPQLRCSSRSNPISLRFQGTRTLIQKTLPGSPTASPGHLGYPDEHSYEGPNCMRFRCRVPE
ncbi:hypothetical protein PUN28_017939 [Cardiocondyla obscurior]|uniref:Uncharacterized protein n=1 Tax=Cardiocondyla obscurior TaxID=286306 RepID=A0AAW2EQE2_9HYME